MKTTISKTRKPMVKVVAPEASTAGKINRLGFLNGEISVPADFDRLGRDEIALMFKSLDAAPRKTSRC